MNQEFDVMRILRRAYGESHIDPAFRSRLAATLASGSSEAGPHGSRLKWLLGDHRFAFAAFAGVVAGVGVAITVGITSALHLIPPTQPELRNLPSDFSACPPPATIGYLVELAPGHTIADLVARGYRATAMRAPALALVGPLEVTQEGAGPTISAMAASLPRQAAVQHSGVVLSRAGAAALSSCNYTLADRPAAQPYLKAAREALFSAGLVSALQLSESPTYSLSDDPLDARFIVVTMDVQGSPVKGGPGPTNRFQTLRFAVILERTTQHVVTLGAWPE